MSLNKGKIKRNSPIPEQNNTKYENELIYFSFKYLELSNSKFDFPDTTIKVNYLAKLLDRLKNISTMKFSEFRHAGKALRSHKIDWDKNTEPNGYQHLSPQMQQCQPWQFSLDTYNLGRIHGLLLSDIFYVVWIDHEHKLYP